MGKNDRDELTTSGWDSITEIFDKIHPGRQVEHYGVLVPWELGGNDPLRGISVYDAGDYWHFVTYGLSELYEKESKDLEWSGYGMEFTLKLKKRNKNEMKSEENELNAEFRCVCGNLQSIARLTFTQGELFLPNEYIYTGQTIGIDLKQTSKLTGFILVEDELAGMINTPNGKVQFVELIGATDAELKAIIDKKLRVKELFERLDSEYTDYERESLF